MITAQRTRRMQSFRCSRRGAIIVLIALLLPVLLIFCGGAVDLAIMQNARTELQAAADLSAKAAAARLSLTGSTSQAIAAGQQVAAANHVSGKPLALSAADFLFGRAERQPSGQWTFTTGQTPFNSVQVTGRRTTGATNGAVSLPFGRVYGRDSFEPVMTATASFIDVDICFVLDRSSSMKLEVNSIEGHMEATDPRACNQPEEDSRWVALEQAMNAFIQNVENSTGSERVAIVTFASDDFSPCGESNTEASIDQGLTSDMEDVEEAMEDRSDDVWNGNTNIDAGIRLAHTLLIGPSARPSADKVMIVLTDGVYTGSDPLVDATAAHDDGIVIHTITFSDGANQSDMQAVASAGEGNHYHAPDAASLNTIFEDLAAMVTVLTE